MPAAWEDDEPSESLWSDPDAWRGEVHLAEPAWTPEPNTQWGVMPGEQPFTIDEDLLGDEEDWCPGGWLEEWGNDEREM